MKNLLKTIITSVLLAISLVGITGCNNNNTNKDNNDEHKTIEVEAGNDVVIKASEITDAATYYNYIVDGVTIQLFAVRATDGTIRVVFNTCGSCNPAPNAYFIQEGDYFVCQNCQNRFHRDQIGLTRSYGCSPIAILDDEKTVDGDTITISSTFIETYKTKFTNINIYEK